MLQVKGCGAENIYRSKRSPKILDKDVLLPHPQICIYVTKPDSPRPRNAPDVYTHNAVNISF